MSRPKRFVHYSSLQRTLQKTHGFPMRIAGGIFALLAGILSCFAVMATGMFCNSRDIALALHANAMIGLGASSDAVFRSGLYLSVLVIAFGASVATSAPRRPGYLLMASSIVGAILGGPVVAICMAMALIGAVLSLFGKRSAPIKNDSVQR